MSEFECLRAPSEEDRAKYREIAVQVWDEWAEKSELSKRVIDAHKAFLTEKGLL